MQQVETSKSHAEPHTVLLILPTLDTRATERFQPPDEFVYEPPFDQEDA